MNEIPLNTHSFGASTINAPYTPHQRRLLMAMFRVGVVPMTADLIVNLDRPFREFMGLRRIAAELLKTRRKVNGR